MQAGWARVLQGDEAGLQLMHEGIAGNRSSMSSIEVTMQLFLLDAYAHLGRHGELLALVDPVLATARRRGENYMMADLLRLKAEALLASGLEEEVAALLEEAEQLAEWLQARALLLRLAMTRARWQGGTALRQLIETRLAAIEGGHDDLDQQAARDLLRAMR